MATSSKSKRNEKIDEKLLSTIKHYHSFYEEPPPGIIPEKKERPEDSIPDLPENQAARDFLAKAPTKGLWMPLGKEPKVMKCWRCKIYGHRSGDKECPLFISGNRKIEEFRHTFEDPMYNYVKENELKEKLKNVEMLKKLLHETKKKKKRKKKRSKSRSKSVRKHRHKSHSSSSSSDSSSSNSSSSSSSSSSSEDDEPKSRKRKRKCKNAERNKTAKRSK